MITIGQLTQRITALFVSPSLTTHTLLNVRTSGPTWTKFQRPGPISNRFLPGKFMIPCVSLDNGTILRVVPYFIPCQEATDFIFDEGENESGEENEDYKEDPWYRTTTTTHNSDTETKTYQHESSDSSSSDSDSSLRIHQDSYIRPEYAESNAESAERQREINTRINARMHQRTRR
jgi:hypothetical protein